MVWPFSSLILICQPNKLSKRSENLAGLFCDNPIANLRYNWLTLKLELGTGQDMNLAAICTDLLKLMGSKSRKKINKSCSMRSGTSRVKFMIYVCPLYSYTSHCSISCSVTSPKTKVRVGKLKVWSEGCAVPVGSLVAGQQVQELKWVNKA